MATEPKKQLRTMAIVCVLMGPMLAMTSLLSHGGVRMLEYLKAQPGTDVTIPRVYELLFGFADRALFWMLGLGLAFFITGLIAMPGGRRGRLSLIAAGWIGLAGMVALTAVWSLEVARFQMHFIWHVIGVTLHGVQMFMLWRGLRYLASPAAIDVAGG